MTRTSVCGIGSNFKNMEDDEREREKQRKYYFIQHARPKVCQQCINGLLMHNY